MISEFAKTLFFVDEGNMMETVNCIKHLLFRYFKESE